MKNFFRDRRGVVAVEFAILAVPMLLMIGLVFFAGVGFLSKSSLTFAVQQSALASVAGQGADYQKVFTANAPSTLTGAAVTCTPGTGSTTCTAGGGLMVPFAGLFGAPDTMTLTASATAAKPAPKP